MIRVSVSLVVWAALCVGAPTARAAWVEPLFMPGEVIAKHADIEAECGKCHVAFDKPAQEGRCLACHKAVAGDRREKQGFHGREPAARIRECRSCHTDHKGRDAQIVPLDRSSFRHRYTDMPLRGAHRKLPCDRCHVDGELYRDAPSQCSACHTDDDPHERALGTACADCHDETDWNTVHFDHDDVFPLEGKHQDVDCEGCHATKRFKPTSRACASCHSEDDRHRGGLGQSCERCHSPQSWREGRFDHTRGTDFRLVGRHVGVACERCHAAGADPARTTTRCYGCHRDDDAHRHRLGQACESCHTPAEWRQTTFDHEKRAGYALRGRHREIRCIACHQDNPAQAHLQRACYACHRGEDVHHGREGTRCDSCHDENGWSRGVLFDHDSTPFPLSGAHDRTTCTQCHMSPHFNEVVRTCVGCHAAEDVHHGKYGPKCERCHEASSFKVTHEPEDQ